MTDFPPDTDPASAPQDDFEFIPPFEPQADQSLQCYPALVPPSIDPLLEAQTSAGPQFALTESAYYLQPSEPDSWISPPTPTEVYVFPEQTMDPYTEYPAAFDLQQINVAGPSTMPFAHTTPINLESYRTTRAPSPVSEASSLTSHAMSELSRGASPDANEMSRWGTRNSSGNWSCAWPGCTSRSTFNRGCDLRKHYKRHSKTLFCRHDGCPQSIEGGFSSKKDRARHEASHNPGVLCEWDGCERLFSRQDNMVCFTPTPACSP
jgi:hypothetical protein